MGVSAGSFVGLSSTWMENPSFGSHGGMLLLVYTLFILAGLVLAKKT